MEKVIKPINPKMLFFFVLVVGLVLLLLSIRMPKYSTTNEYMILNEEYAKGVISREKYLDEFNKNNYIRTSIMDVGNGLITFSVLALAFTYVKKINQWKDFLKIKAAKKINLFLLLNGSLLLLMFGSYFYYIYRAWRNDYPPYADSVGIPIFYNTLFYLLCIIPLNLFLCLVLIKSDLQTPLCVKYTKGLVVWRCIFFLSSLLLIVMLIFSVIDGDHASIISNLALIYIVLSLRAGKVKYYLNKS